jgi:4-hydroxybenzoate polyprenyltransferase
MLSFCGASSAMYVINDLLDLDADRNHFIKCRRPFAAGELPVAWAFWLAPVLLAPALWIAFRIAPAFAAWVAVYLLTTIAYSVFLKTQPLLDVICLAGLYGIRVWAGGAATAIPISAWTMAFVMFLFFSLALAKRYSELYNLTVKQERWAERRGYETSDMPCLQTLGISSGMLAVLVLALYIHSNEITALYRRPETLWLLCPLIGYWMGRLWLLASRGRMNEDPVVFAFRDGTTYLVGAAVLAVIAAATVAR